MVGKLTARVNGKDKYNHLETITMTLKEKWQS